MVFDDKSFLLFFVVGFFLPFLVDLVTRKLADSKVKSLTLLALTLVGSGATELISNGFETFDWKTWAYGFAFTFLSAVATLFGFSKPAGLSGSDGKVADLVPGFIGTPGVKVLAQEVAPATEVAPVTSSDLKKES